MKIGKCKLCHKKRKLTKHHLIPQSVIKVINPESSLKTEVTYLCKICHKSVHMSFISHLYGKGFCQENFNEFDAFKYYLIKKFMTTKEQSTWKKWNLFYKKFIEKEMEEF